MNLIYFYDSLSIGPNKKALSQCINLVKNGLTVKLFIVVPRRTINLASEFSDLTKLALSDHSTGSSIFHRIRHQFELRNVLIDLIKSSSKSDIIYIRYPYPLFYMLLPISKRGRSCVIVNEHNTIGYNQSKLAGFYLSMIIDLLVGKMILRNTDGIVGVTDEITSYELMRSGDLNKPHITIGNGIDVNKIKLRKPPAYIDQELKIICVASFSRWHAIDRLLYGLLLYRGDRTIRVYLVGDGLELNNIRKMTNDLKLDNYIIFTGILSGNDLDDLFNTSHIAVGSLGLHRIDMKEGSILKAREYCARGIPFIYGCFDSDFPINFPYIKRIPGDESPIDIEEIIHFAEKIYSDTEHHKKMRAYAEKNLDWSVKMKKLTDFCATLVEK